MRNRAALLCLVALIVTVARPLADKPAANESGLSEVAAPIVVDMAPDVLVGPDHEPDPEIQEAMEAHAAELQARRRAEVGEPGAVAGSLAAASGGLTATYPTGAPDSVKAVVNAAVANWDSVIATNPAGPIVIEVSWSSLNHSSLLGYAGPESLWKGGALPTNALYPAALTNTLLATDVNGPSRPEIAVTLNADLLASDRWYLGTTGTPPAGKIDLYSVVLHEVGHGLGFLGSAHIPSGQTDPVLYDPPYIYDTLTTFNGAAMTSVGDQSAALVSNDVQTSISADLTYEVYTPSTWTSGSSFSHFDEATYPGGTAGALMTPMLGSAETARILDSPTLGLMARMGWPLTVGATTPTINSASPALTSASVSWDPNLWHSGVAPDSYVIEAWQGATIRSSATVGGSATTGSVPSLSPGEVYSIKVVPIGPAGAGVAATTSVQLPIPPDPIDPEDWPIYIENRPLDGQINRIFQAYFLRVADPGGFTYWMDQRAAGTPLADVSSALAGSAEFQARYGSLSDEAFIDLIYANVLSRSPDPGGRNHWLAQLHAGMSRGEVMIGFSESAEFVGRTQTVAAGDPLEAEIQRLYRAFFLRDPDPGGLAHWAGLARSGLPLTSIAESFATSSEFQGRYGPLDNASFVNLVYTNVLGRAADPAGAAHWTSLLDAGTPRGTVMVGFSESAEFVRSTGTTP